MTNATTNHSAGLMLDEDFVNRAMALRGGQNLDGAFLMDLLEAGLAIMELSAGNHDERCGNPDCAGCRIRRGERPSPTAVTEFEAMYEQLQRAADDAAAGKDAHRPITMMVSEASLIFMAYLDRLIEASSRGGLRLVGKEIDIDNQAEIERVGRYLSHMLVDHLERELEAFVEGCHPLLLPPRRTN